jgi:hypothetical protein
MSPGVRGRQPHDLGDVERGAAAEADHAVGRMRAVGVGAGHHLRAGGVAEDAVEDRHIQPAQVAAELGQHRQPGQRAVGDDQRALAPLRQQVLGDELAGAGAEGDGGGEGEAGDGHGVPIADCFGSSCAK